MFLLTERYGVGHLVFAQALNQHVDCEVAVQLVDATSYVFEARQDFLNLHAWKYLADVVNSVVDIGLRLKGSCSCNVTYQARQLSCQHHAHLSLFNLEAFGE